MANQDKIKSQLIDDGAVIGYRPDLQYSKSLSSTGNAKNTLNNTTNEKYSQTVKSFLENLPSTVIMDLADTVNTINEAIKRLEEVLPEDVTIFASTSVSTSLIPDIIDIMVLEKERLDILIDTLKVLYYGTSSLTNEDYKRKDEELISSLTELEAIGKVNYLTLSYDSLLNKSVYIYSSKVDTAVLQLEQVAYLEDDTLVTDKNLISNIEVLHKEVDNEIKDRTSTYKLQQSSETMKKTLYNYYLKRNELKHFFDIVISCSTEGSFLINKLDKYDADVQQALEEVNKTNLGNVYFMHSIEHLMTEKQHLISLCATLSYK